MCQPASCGIPTYFMSGQSFGKKELAQATFVYYKRPLEKMTYSNSANIVASIISTHYISKKINRSLCENEQRMIRRRHMRTFEVILMTTNLKLESADTFSWSKNTVNTDNHEEHCIVWKAKFQIWPPDGGKRTMMARSERAVGCNCVSVLRKHKKMTVFQKTMF